MKKRNRPPAKKKKQPQVEVLLTTRHSVNGVSYGPGRLLVPEDLAATLREQDQRAQQEDSRFHNREPRAFIIGPGGRKVRVPAEQFENLHHAFPIGTASLKGFSLEGSQW